jgi:hypothetical protein
VTLRYFARLFSIVLIVAVKPPTIWSRTALRLLTVSRGKSKDILKARFDAVPMNTRRYSASPLT